MSLKKVFERCCVRLFHQRSQPVDTLTLPVLENGSAVIWKKRSRVEVDRAKRRPDSPTLRKMLREKKSFGLFRACEAG